MKDIQELITQYNKIISCLGKNEESIVKEVLKEELARITLSIKEELKKEQLRGNNSLEFIQLCSRFDALTTMDQKDNKDNDSKEKTTEVENQKYTLSSKKIISAYDGSEIDISNLSRIERVKTIYEHTGVEVTVQDPEILALCELRFQQFLRGCHEDTYLQKYGPNWKVEVEKIYKNNYLATAQKCIAAGLNEVDEKNRKRSEELSEQLKDSEDQIETLAVENNKSFEERENLVERVTQLKLQKEELEQYKLKINEMIKNNSEDKNRFYSDGTLKPDMDNDEYGRYTTSRKNRSRETGMQQRVNDAAHVHSPLDSRDRERRQRKYEEVFGAIPKLEEAVEETKPKSR